jgi:amino acid adenylation domain-containing protein
VDAVVATDAQHRLWALERLVGDRPVFHASVALRVRGDLETEALRRALHGLVAGHEALRTRLEHDGHRLVQAILPPSATRVELAEPGHRLEAWLAERARQPFADGAPLARVAVARLATDEHVVALVAHRAVIDEASLQLLLDELAERCARSRGDAGPAPRPRLHFPDFAHWQLEALSAARKEELLEHWRRRLQGVERLDLPTDRPRPRVRALAGDVVRRTLPTALWDRTTARAAALEASPLGLLLAAQAMALATFSGQDDFVVAVPVAGRSVPGAQGIVGSLSRPLPVRVQVGDRGSVGDLARRLHADLEEAEAHQDVPIELLVAELGQAIDPAWPPLAQTLLELREPLRVPAIPRVEAAVERLDTATTFFDLRLTLEPGADGLLAAVRYDAALFDAATAEAMLDGFEHALAQVVDRPELALAQAPRMPEAEAAALHGPLSGRDRAPVPGPPRAEHWLRRNAAEHPHGVALAGHGVAVTHAELAERAARLARGIDRAAGPGAIVAVLVPRGPEAVLAHLAVLTAGRAFLPLDPNYPAPRLQAMAQDAQPALVVTTAALADEARLLSSAPLLLLDAEGQDDDGVPPPGAAQEAAYVIYTSGSTGLPKGVLVEHRTLVAIAGAAAELLELGPADVVLQFAPQSFDAFVWELFSTLAAGARLWVAPGERILVGRDLADEIRAGAVTVVTAPPSVLGDLAALGIELPSLRLVVTAGEPCPPALVAAWTARGVRVINAYGPTEATICATAHRCDGTEATVPIGQPLPGVEVHVVDERLRPLPRHARGELLVGGAGVSAGYLRRPAETAARFLPDPWAVDRPGARLYRTGDVVRRRADGALEFLGRADRQLKLRGHRIEPGEIEHQLRTRAGVADAAVTVHVANLVERLVAFVVPEPGASLDPYALRAELVDRLPAYMLPHHVEIVDALPTTPAGKVDRALLRLAPLTQVARRREGVPADTAAGRLVQRAAAAVLGVEVDADDNLVDLGLDSLMAARVVARLRERGLDVPPRTIFEHVTVRGIERALAASPPAAA